MFSNHLIEHVVQQVLAAGLGIFSGVPEEGNDCIPDTAQLLAVTLNAVHLQQQRCGWVIELLCASPQNNLQHVHHLRVNYSGPGNMLPGNSLCIKGSMQ